MANDNPIDAADDDNRGEPGVIFRIRSGRPPEIARRARSANDLAGGTQMKKRPVIFAVVILSAMLIASMMMDHPPEPPSPPAGAVWIPIPTDPTALYHAVAMTYKGDGLVEITTRRASKGLNSNAREAGYAPVLYSKRLIDCGQARFMYLAENGETPESMHPSQGSHMGRLTPHSISTYVASYACKAIGWW